MLRDDRLRHEVIQRNVEEALDLVGVQVHGQHAVCAGLGDHVGDELGRNRRSALGLAILPGIAEVRYDRRDPPGRRPPHTVDENQQFHQIVVHGRAGRLHHEAIPATDIVFQLDQSFAVRIASDRRTAHRDIQVAHDLLGQGQAAGSCKDL